MATLQKIRNHGVLLLVIVGLAMLAFILGDFLNSGSSFFNRDRENIGSVNGKDIHYTEYEAAREQLEDVYKIEYGRSDFDEEMAAYIRNQTWELLLEENILNQQAAQIGMTVTVDELSNLCIGEKPDQNITSRRIFAGADGQFSRENLLRFYEQLFVNEDVTPEMEEQMEQYKRYWLYWEKVVRLNTLQGKYNALVQSLIKPNSLDAKYAFDARMQSAEADYVFRPYYAVADSLVSVSTSDAKKIYNERKPLYKQTPNRSLSYIEFPIVPSEQDFAEAQQLILSLEQQFRTTDEIALVVNVNSDRMYDGRDYSETTVPAQYKEFAFAKGAKVGDCTDISFADNTYSIARIMDCGYSLPDSVELKAIAMAEGQEDAEIGWVRAEVLPQNIAEKALHGKRGERFTVEQGMGEQTFEILDISPATPEVKLAILERQVNPSSRTYSVLYNQAKQFIVAHNSDTAIVEAAKREGMQVHPQYGLVSSADKIGDLKSSRAIVRWAFEAKEGDVSDVFECGDKFVVAVLNEVNEEAFRPFSEVQAELTAEAANRKKADYIIDQLHGATSLEEAAEIWGVPVLKAEHVTLAASRFGNQGAEPAVIGATLAQEAGQVSAPLTGVAGVYMVKTTAKNTQEGEFNVEQEKQQLAARNSYMTSYRLHQILRDNADIRDKRINFQ